MVGNSFIKNGGVVITDYESINVIDGFLKYVIMIYFSIYLYFSLTDLNK